MGKRKGGRTRSPAGDAPKEASPQGERQSGTDPVAQVIDAGLRALGGDSGKVTVEMDGKTITVSVGQEDAAETHRTILARLRTKEGLQVLAAALGATGAAFTLAEGVAHAATPEQTASHVLVLPSDRQESPVANLSSDLLDTQPTQPVGVSAVRLNPSANFDRSLFAGPIEGHQGNPSRKLVCSLTDPTGTVAIYQTKDGLEYQDGAPVDLASVDPSVLGYLAAALEPGGPVAVVVSHGDPELL